MNKQNAIALSLAVWTWLAANPGKPKENLPKPLYDAVKGLVDKCPLCEYQGSIGKRSKRDRSCPGCPLDTAGENCFQEDSAYQAWQFGNQDKKSAKRIRNILIVEVLK